MACPEGVDTHIASLPALCRRRHACRWPSDRNPNSVRVKDRPNGRKARHIGLQRESGICGNRSTLRAHDDQQYVIGRAVVQEGDAGDEWAVVLRDKREIRVVDLVKQEFGAINEAQNFDAIFIIFQSPGVTFTSKLATNRWGSSLLIGMGLRKLVPCTGGRAIPLKDGKDGMRASS